MSVAFITLKNYSTVDEIENVIVVLHIFLKIDQFCVVKFQVNP